MSLFGQKVKCVRQSLGFTQEELATLLHTTKQVVSRYESGMRVPKISTALGFAQALLVPVDYLVDESIPVEQYHKDTKKANLTAIKIERERQGISVEAFSRATSISISKLNAIDNGTADPTASELCSISDALHLSIDYLLGRSWLACGQHHIITDNESLLLSQYRSADTETKNYIHGVLRLPQVSLPFAARSENAQDFSRADPDAAPVTEEAQDVDLAP